MRKIFYIIIVGILITSTAFASNPKDMVKIEAGTFWMGSDAGNQAMPHGGINNEAPAHEVTIDGYWIDQYPVTNDKYAKFVEETKFKTYSEIPPKAEDWPGALPENLVPASIVT